MKLASRFFYQRLAMLDRLIRAGKYPSARDLADQLEVSRRTILRDVEMARDRLGMPLVYDPKRKGFDYTDPTYRLSFTTLTEGDLEALRTAQLALAPFHGLPDQSNLIRATQKVVLGLIDQAVPDDGSRQGRSYRFSMESRSEPDRFAAVDRAIRMRSRIKLRYYSASSDAESDREIDPLHLVSIDGKWFLIAFCLRHQEIRMFALGRIRNWTPTDHHFDPPESFCIEQYLAQSLGMLRGGVDELYTVRLRFRGAAVRYVREQVLHPSQVAELTPDGAWLVQLEVSHLREVERLALSWGADCLVLDPPELREQVARTLERVMNCSQVVGVV